MRTRFAVGALLLVCGFAAACAKKDGDNSGGNITGPSNPTPTINISATPNMLATVTDSTKVTVTWNAANVTSCSATWTTSTATSGTAIVVPVVSGIAQQNVGYPMTCTGPNGTVQNAAGVTVLGRATYTATGNLQLANIQPGESSTGWTVKLTIGNDSVVGKVDASGNYTLVDTLSTQTAPAGTANVMIMITPSNSRYAPMYSSRTASASGSLTWTMIPNTWCKEAGVDAGKCFPVNPDSLMAAPGGTDLANFWSVRRNPNTPSGIVGGYISNTWKAQFPIPVAFDRTRSTSPITDHDSANFKLAIDTLNARAGRQLFVMANYSDVVNGKGVLVFVDSTLATDQGPDGTGASGLQVRTLDANGDIAHADVSFLSEAFFQDQWIGVGLFPHEMVHTLGFGHTCGKWNSLMRGVDSTACAGPVGTQVAADLDLVYIEMTYEVAAMQRAHNTNIGFAEWLNGSLVAQGKAPSTSAVLP